MKTLCNFDLINTVIEDLCAMRLGFTAKRETKETDLKSAEGDGLGCRDEMAVHLAEREVLRSKLQESYAEEMCELARKIDTLGRAIEEIEDLA